MYLGNSGIDDLKGSSTGASFSTPGVKFGARGSLGLSSENTPVLGLKVSIGSPTEAHFGININETKVDSQKVLIEGFDFFKSFRNDSPETEKE